MKVTLSVIKADIGSIGGHVAPSRHLLDIVRGEVAQLACDLDLVIDHCVSFTGDGIAILMTHTRGMGDPAVHGLAWDALEAGTRAAKAEGLYGAGQDLLQRPAVGAWSHASLAIDKICRIGTLFKGLRAFLSARRGS